MYPHNRTKKTMNEVTNKITKAVTDDRNVTQKATTKLHNTQSFIDTNRSFIRTQKSIRGEYHGRFPY